MPEYLQKRGHKNPIDSENVFLQGYKGFKGDLFEYLKENPHEGASFNHIVDFVLAKQLSWTDIMPTETFLKGADPKLPLVVNVGGNVGCDIERFRKKYTDTAAQLYLEDKPAVVALSKVLEPVHEVCYDFFMPQPMTQVAAFQLAASLSQACASVTCTISCTTGQTDRPTRFLQALHGALKPGYGKLSIHNHVIRDPGAHPHTTSFDLTVMLLVAGNERTETECQVLPQSVGYKIVKIRRSSLDVQAII